MPTITDQADEVDGRRLRREQNREAVMDALVSLFREGVYEPGSNEIAERAGLSPRSLFRYFDDVDDLSRAAIDRQLSAARPLLDVGIGADAPTRAKIEHLVAARIELFDTIAPAARAARVCAHRHPVVAAQLRDGRAYLRRQVAHAFATELHGDRATLLPAVDALTSFETYDLLRSDQRMSRARTESVLVDALGKLLGASRG
jgi:AcrR family transcriptional regulator